MWYYPYNFSCMNRFFFHVTYPNISENPTLYAKILFADRDLRMRKARTEKWAYNLVEGRRN